MSFTIDDIKRWKSYGFVMTPVENKRPKGKTWRKDWSDDELLKAERLGFYQKDSNVFTIDFDDQGWTLDAPETAIPDNDGGVYNEAHYVIAPSENFGSFAIKIVLRTTNSSYVPSIKDFRAIASL